MTDSVATITNIIIDYLLRRRLKSSVRLKTDSSADHTADTGAARPTAADLTFSPNTSIGTTDSHATRAAIALVVGVERTGETGGRGARVGVGELEGLHRSGAEEKGSKSFYDTKGENSFMLFSGGAGAAAEAFGAGFATEEVAGALNFIID